MCTRVPTTRLAHCDSHSRVPWPSRYPSRDQGMRLPACTTHGAFAHRHTPTCTTRVARNTEASDALPQLVNTRSTHAAVYLAPAVTSRNQGRHPRVSVIVRPKDYIIQRSSPASPSVSTSGSEISSTSATHIFPRPQPYRCPRKDHHGKAALFRAPFLQMCSYKRATQCKPLGPDIHEFL